MVLAIRGASVLLVAFAWAGSLQAQSLPVVDLGVVAARFTGEGLSALGPQLRVSAGGVQRHFFESVEIGAMGTSSAASAFGAAVAGIRSAQRGPLLGDIAAELSAVGSTSSGGRAITSLLAARGAFDARSSGGWIRVGGQFASREADSFFGESIDAASWWRFGQSLLTATLNHEWTRAELYKGATRHVAVGSAPVEYLEAGANLHTETGRALFDLGASTRRDAGAVHLYEQSLNARAAYWTGDRTALVMSAAHLLPDYVRGGDAVDAVSVGVRFGQAAPAVANAALRVAMVQLTGTSDMRTLRVHAYEARTVEIMGDFTDWEPRPMTRNGPTFESTMRVSSGTHRLVVRIDGGAWSPPTNTPAVDDDFGGRVGLLVVP